MQLPKKAPRTAEEGTDKDGFKVPKHVLDKRKKRAKVITGKSDAASAGGLKGAPVDLFVFRVEKEAVEEDLRELITKQGCQVRGITLMSKEEAKFKSFKLTIPAAQKNTVFSDSFPWPDGVKVRRFIPKRKVSPTTAT